MGIYILNCKVFAGIMSLTAGIRSIVCLLLFCLSLSLIAQRGDVMWLDAKDGLSQGYVFSMIQDAEGYIWAGTKNGLNRYDGYSFKVFGHDPYDPFSIDQEVVTSITDYKDYLVIITNTMHIQFFNKHTHKCYRLPADFYKKKPEGLIVYNTTVDNEGTLWAAYLSDKETHIYKHRMPEGFWTSNVKKSNWWQEIEVTEWAVFQQYAGFFKYSDRKGGLVRIDNRLYTIINGFHDLTEVYNFTDKGYGGFFMDDQGFLWISSHDSPAQDILRFKIDGTDLKKLTVDTIRTHNEYFNVVSVKTGLLWLQTDATLRMYTLDSNALFDPKNSPYEEFDNPKGKYTFLQDRTGLFWVGTTGLGIKKLNPRSKKFQNYFLGQSIYSSILKDEYNNIITKNNTNSVLKRIEKATKETDWYQSTMSRFISSKSITDQNNTTWILGQNGPSSRMELIWRTAYGQTDQVALKDSPRYNCVFQIDSDGSPWIAFPGELLQWDALSKSFIKHDFSHLFKIGVVVNDLVQIDRDTWGIGTEKGLVIAHFKMDSVDWKLYQNDPGSKNSLRNNRILTLLGDPAEKHILWIGTEGGGLNRLNLKSDSFTNYYQSGGFPNDVIYGILADDDHNLWMSSNKGLIFFDPKTGRIQNFTPSDGLPAYEFNRYAYSKAKDGSLIFGGVNGLAVFNPADFKASQVIPGLVINSFLVNDQAIQWNVRNEFSDQENDFPHKIVLPYSSNNVTLRFAVMDFLDPGNNRFRFFLQGAEDEWTHESSENTASYLNLAPGSYVFKVKGMNSTGIWSEVPTEMVIIILPPWYASIWAFMLYAIITVFAFYYYYQYNLRQRLKQLETDRLKQMDAFKNHFFTNITHEFRTPLTVILGMTEKAIQANPKQLVDLQKKSSFHVIRRNGMNLLRLINEILDIAKLESNSLSIKYIQGNILPYLQYLTESIHSFAEIKGIIIRIESEAQEIIMDYDAEKIQQIVHNLLSNAIKFSPNDGEIILSANKVVENEQVWFKLAVKDTGVGIPKEDLGRIFDRFYQSKNTSKSKAGGTGIGLALIKELSKAMGGDITVTSTPGVSTVFEVKLPLTNKAAFVEKEEFIPNFELSEHSILQAVIANAEEINENQPLLLIIEDNPDVILYLKACLETDYQLIFAYDGVMGIEKALSSIPDIIISDVMMPAKDGFDVCDELKNDERSSHIPIILLTARSTVADRIAGLRKGADAYLAKPFNEDELKVILSNLLEQRARLQKKYSLIREDITDIGPKTEVLERDPFLCKMDTFIEASLGNSEISLDEFQTELGMSRSQIFRKLKALTGDPPVVYIRKYRMNRAMSLVLDSDKSISEIAYLVGYSSPAYFTKVFQDVFAKPPSEFR